MHTSGTEGVFNQTTPTPINPKKPIDTSEKLAADLLLTKNQEETAPPLVSKKTLKKLSSISTIEHLFKNCFPHEKKTQGGPYRETLLSQKVSFAKGIATSVVNESQSVLQAILLRIKMSPSMIGATAPHAITGMGLTLGSLTTALSLQEIGISLSDTVLQLRKLRKEGHATPKEVSKILFRQFLPDRPLVKDLVALACGTISLVRIGGTLTHSLSPAVLTSLTVASVALGTVLGALTTILGVIITFSGIKNAIQAGQKLYQVNKDLKSFQGTKRPDNIIDFLKETRLQTTNRIQQKELTKGILKACLGTFVTAAGALGIAAVFTMGWTAIGIVIAGIVLGVFATGVSIGGAIYQKRSEKKIQQDVETALSKMDEKLMQSDQWNNIVKELVTDEFISKEFGISKKSSLKEMSKISFKLENYSLDERKDLLRKYCLSSKISEKSSKKQPEMPLMVDNPTDVNVDVETGGAGN